MHKIDEETCLKMILNPEFVDRLSVLKQTSKSTICASTQSDIEAFQPALENATVASPLKKKEVENQEDEGDVEKPIDVRQAILKVESSMK